jgi:hypothetical protein
MASPFHVFRKHQKVMLAAITILAMFAFVFVSPFARFGGGTANRQQQVYATWEFGDITRSEVDQRVAMRYSLNDFLRKAIFGDSRDLPAMLQQYSFFSEDKDRALDAIVLHKKAEQMGLAISDQEVNQFIDGITERFAQRTLSQQTKDKLARTVTFMGQSISEDQLFDGLRFELMQQRLAVLLGTDATDLSTPDQRWDYFVRHYRLATIEAMPVEVKDFTAKVPDPDDKDLQAYFEKYKDQYTTPTSPEPGFKQWPRAAFGYYTISIADLVKEEKPKVTEQEIKDYYEKNKDDFKVSPIDDTAFPDVTKPDVGKTPDAGKKPEAGKTPNTSKKPDGEKAPAPATTPDAGKKPGDSKPAETKAPEAGKTSDKIPPATTPTETKTDAGKKDDVEKKPATETKPDAEKKPDGDKKPDAAGKSVQQGAGRFVGIENTLALADDKTPPASDKEPAKTVAPTPEPPKADVPKSEASKTDALKPEPAKPDAGKTEPAKTTQDKAVPDKTPADKTPADKSSPDKSSGDKSAPILTQPITDPFKAAPSDLSLPSSKSFDKTPLSQYQPLDKPKVHNDIRDRLAREKAETRVDEQFKKLSGRLSSYAAKLSSWRARKVAGEKAPPPPNFKALELEFELKYTAIKPVTMFEASETELGKSQLDQFNFVSFIQQGFNPSLMLYKPYTARSPDNETAYLWWRSQFVPTFVPEFSKVHAEVLASWKMGEARKLAMEKARQYADDVTEHRSELKEMFATRANLEVKKVGPFTWLTRDSVAAQPGQPPATRLTPLPQLDKVGVDFMRAVFSLDVGKTGEAWNEPKTVVYVIQVIDFESLMQPGKGEDTFRRDFLRWAAANPNPNMQSSSEDAMRNEAAKIQAIKNEYDVKKIPLPDDMATNKGGPTAPADDSDDSSGPGF